jgi:hypothetical protein
MLEASRLHTCSPPKTKGKSK